MSSKSKAVVAVCIVAGILGLIIFDLAMAPGKPKTTTATNQAPATDTGEQVIKLLGGDSAPTPATPAPQTPAPVDTVQKGAAETQDPIPAVAPTNEEYEIKPGDSFWSIAKKKYGDGAHFELIVKANPTIDKDRPLPVGKKIVLPPKPMPTSMKGANEISSNSKVHTVEVGESLYTISQRYYKTAKYAKAIFEANKELIKAPDRLKAGLQIIIPNITPTPAPAAQAPETATETPAPPASEVPSKRVHKVVPGDSLWKIAAKYEPKRVNEMIEKIVQANRDKLESEDTMLKTGWELVIPESR
jgi:nucleoid-associated protein YgaU